MRNLNRHPIRNPDNIGFIKTVRLDRAERIAIVTLVSGETHRFPLPPQVLEAPVSQRANFVSGRRRIDWPGVGVNVSLLEILTSSQR